MGKEGVSKGNRSRSHGGPWGGGKWSSKGDRGVCFAGRYREKKSGELGEKYPTIIHRRGGDFPFARGNIKREAIQPDAEARSGISVEEKKIAGEKQLISVVVFFFVGKTQNSLE